MSRLQDAVTADLQAAVRKTMAKSRHPRGARNRGAVNSRHIGQEMSLWRVERQMASVATAMLENYPGSTIEVRHEILTNCVAACLKCSLACTACSDACLAESDITELVKCIRTDLDCADMCDATAKVLTRQTAYDLAVIRSTVTACLKAIVACAEECERHAAHHKHCQISAMVCREAERACEDLLVALDSQEPGDH